MFDDHVIWIQTPQKEVYLFIGHPVEGMIESKILFCESCSGGSDNLGFELFLSQ